MHAPGSRPMAPLLPTLPPSNFPFDSSAPRDAEGAATVSPHLCSRPTGRVSLQRLLPDLHNPRKLAPRSVPDLLMGVGVAPEGLRLMSVWLQPGQVGSEFVVTREEFLTLGERISERQAVLTRLLHLTADREVPLELSPQADQLPLCRSCSFRGSCPRAARLSEARIPVPGARVASAMVETQCGRPGAAERSCRRPGTQRPTSEGFQPLSCFR